MYPLTTEGGLEVEVVSLLAAITGGTPYGLSWRGIIPREFLAGLPVESEPGQEANELNECLYRIFQRVEDSDTQRLERLGYRLPSLSAGDLIAWGRACYRVLAIGFERLEPTAALTATVRHCTPGEPAPPLIVFIREYVESHPNPTTALTVALTALARISHDTNLDPATVPVLAELGVSQQILDSAF